jgi:hypothetical protein
MVMHMTINYSVIDLERVRSKYRHCQIITDTSYVLAERSSIWNFTPPKHCDRVLENGSFRFAGVWLVRKWIAVLR